MSLQALYRQKLRTLPEAVGMLQSYQTLGLSMAASEPVGLLTELGKQRDRRAGQRQADEAPAEQNKTSATAGMTLAFRLGSEFVAGVLVGAGLGWGIDRLLGTAPWGMIVLLLLGFGAGIANMMRAAGEGRRRK